ncbi:hypothetical protein ACI2TX_24885 [Ralstonia nicotianae]
MTVVDQAADGIEPDGTGPALTTWPKSPSSLGSTVRVKKSAFTST